MSPFEPVLDEKPGARVVDPPLATKIRYRFGGSIPEDYRTWVERDVGSVAFPLRLFVTHTVIASAVVALFNVVIDGFNPWPYLIGFTIAAIAHATFFCDFHRRRAREWHEKRWNTQRERDESPDFRRLP